METQYIVESAVIFSSSREKLLLSIHKDQNWLQSYVLLLSSVSDRDDQRYSSSLERFEWMNKELMTAETPLLVTDPQSGKDFEEPPVPTFVIIKKPPEWNSVLKAAAKEIQTRLWFTRSKLESHTIPTSVGVVGIAESRKDAEEQMKSIFGNEFLRKFTQYRLVYSEGGNKYAFKLDWLAFPDKMFTGGGGFAEVVEKTTPEGRKRLEAKKAFRYMIETNLLYSTKRDPLPNSPTLLKYFAREYLEILQPKDDDEIEQIGIFSFNYKRHLKRYLLWISIDVIYFKTSITERLELIQREKDLGENIAYVTWYSLLSLEEVDRLRKTLINI